MCDLEPIEVLLVEDDPGDVLMTREAFEDNKIRNRLHVARDGEEALDFLYRRGAHAGAPAADLILLDLNLPKYDGRQILEQIKSDPDWYGAYADKTALKRWATPDEIVGAILFLASDASTFVTGTLQLVEGGWTAVDGRFVPKV